MTTTADDVHDCAEHAPEVVDPVEPPSTEFPEGQVPNFMDLEPGEVAEEKVRPLNEKIRFAFKDHDESILVRIETASEVQFNTLFADAIQAVNVLLTKHNMTLPGMEPGIGMLTGQDIEQCIMDLSRVQLLIRPELTKLKNRYIYAKMNAGDAHDAGWRSIHGTTGDKDAKGNIASQQDRYHAYFCYHLWSTAEAFDKELTNFVFRMRDIRNWRVQAQPR
jgi:hypothetical protein